MFEVLKRRYANKTVEEIAKEAIELGYNSKIWNSKTFQATQLRDVIAVRLAKENNLCSSTQFEEIMRLTNEVMEKVS